MKRRHTLPRDFWKHPVRGGFFEQLKDLSPRQRYIAEQSILRYERRAIEMLYRNMRGRGLVS